MRERLREAAEAEAAAAAIEQEDWELVTCDAAGLPFGMVGELRRKLSPIVLLVLLLFMGVDLMDIRVSAVFPSSRQRAAFLQERGCFPPPCGRHTVWYGTDRRLVHVLLESLSQRWLNSTRDGVEECRM